VTELAKAEPAVAPDNASLESAAANGTAAPGAQRAVVPADPNRAAQANTAYLVEVMSAMYPGPCALASADVYPDGPLVTEFRAVPHARRPRMLVPASRRAAAAAVRRYPQSDSGLGRIERGLAVLALRTGASALVLRDRIQVARPPGTPVPDTIDQYLRRALKQDVLLSVHIGRERATRKPVLQLLTPEGKVIGFAKLGIDPPTRQLVRMETIALVTLDHLKLRRVQAPRVLHAGRWRNTDVLVQQALPSWGRRAEPPARLLTEAMRELAWSTGVSRGPLAGSRYWRALHERLRGLATLGRVADELVLSMGDLELTFGAWHGDWVPENMAAVADRLLLWDWEQFAQDVPVGLDALHYDLAVRLAAGLDPGQALDATFGRAAGLLAPFGVGEPEAVRATGLLYAIDLATRYPDDRDLAARVAALARP
jgi:hypothetical protein